MCCTRIRIRPYFVEWKTQQSLWMDGWIFRVEKRTRGSTALKQCFTEDLILLLNLREILPIQGNLRYTGHLFGPNFGRDWNRTNLLEISQSMIDSVFSKKLVRFQSLPKFELTNYVFYQLLFARIWDMHSLQ